MGKKAYREIDFFLKHHCTIDHLVPNRVVIGESHLKGRRLNSSFIPVFVDTFPWKVLIYNGLPDSQSNLDKLSHS